MSSIQSEHLCQSLVDLCMDTPNIDLRPRCVVAAILPQQYATTAARQYREKNALASGLEGLSGNQDNEMVDLDSDTFGVEENDSGDIGSFSSSKTVFVSEDTCRRRVPDTDKHGEAGKRESKHRRRESFFQFDEDEDDFTFDSTSTPPDSSPVSLQTDPMEEPTDLDPFASEEYLPIHVSNDGPIKTPLRQIARDVKNSSHKISQLESCPAVVLTSGEIIFADAVLGSMVPRSPVLQTIKDSASEGNAIKERKNKNGLEVVREDRVYR